MTPVESTSELTKLDAAAGRLKKVELTADVSGLSPEDRKALDKITAAARFLDPLFLRQVWGGNAALQEKLNLDQTPLGLARLHWFRVNAGPWSRLDRGEAFLVGVPPHQPLQAGFYPEDMSKEEFESWVKGLSETQKKQALGFFSVVRRGAGRPLTLVPYSQEYRAFLEPAARLLKDAAGMTTNQSLKKYLTARADAFLTDDYYPSDVAWMELDAPLEITIGPYETYEDGLFNYKAAFEAFITVRDEADSAKLQKYSQYLQEIENHLPFEDKYKNPRLGAVAPIRVVDEVFASGDGNRGVQTAAFNLPNDERVIKEKGSKRVMLKNVQEAKFKEVLVPIAQRVLEGNDLKVVAFEPFFTHILMHELMHGLGPQNIKVAGRETTVRQELKALHSAIEEAKADITGLFALQYLIDKGVIDKRVETAMYTTYLASMFRSVRFGINEAHGKGTAMQFNYLSDKGAVVRLPNGKFRVEPTKIKSAVRDLTHDLLTIEAEGSYDGAKAILDRYAVIRPEMQAGLDLLSGIPIDIDPSYPLAN